MKRHLFIGFVFGLAMLVACNKPGDGSVAMRHGTSLPHASSPELANIDSLMWRQPDSALAVLQQFAASPKADSLDEYNGHYCQLLISELLYKNDYGQSNRLALQQAVAYFDSLILTLKDTPTLKRLIAGSSFREGGTLSLTRNDNIHFLTARAHYINGVGYYECDSVVEACKEYMKALEIMENHFKEKELVGHKARFVALTYTRLSSLFSDMYLHEQAIYFAQLSLASNQELNVPNWHFARLLCEIGIQYNLLEQLDSANYYYERAAIELNDTNCLLYRDITIRQIVLSYKKRGLEENTLLQLRNLMSKSDDETEYLLRCFTIGGIYYQEKQLDSAWFYLNKVYNSAERIALKKQSAEWLLDICKIEGKDDDVFEYADFLVPFANQEENQSAIKSHLTELYNVFWQREKELQHQVVARRNMKQTMTVVCILLSFILTLLVLHFKRKQSYKAQLETERHSHKMQQAALAGRLRQSNAALKAQSKAASPIAPSSYKQEQNEAESYAEEPVCQQILAVCNDKSNPVKSTIPVSSYAGIALTDAQKAQLKDAAMRHYGPLFEKLKLQYPELKEKDFLYCYLCLLGLDNMQIAVLSQLSYRTIWEREKRLQTLFHADDRIAVVLHEMMIH